MVGPARKREAVTHVQSTLCTSQRRACSSLDQPRSTQRYQTRQPNIDAKLTRALRRIAEREPRADRNAINAHLIERQATQHTNPRRPGRSESQAIKRRPKNFHFLTKPRREMGNLPHREKGLAIHQKSSLS
ncbi:MAG: hypothetical protein ACFUZC_08645 [Chthoniobacteraceae bacterium]